MLNVSFLSTFSFKLRTAIFLSVLAFISSLGASFFSGAVILVIIIRLIAAIFIFAALGYCIGYILTKYVPEVVALFQMHFGSDSDPDMMNEGNESVGMEGMEGMEGEFGLDGPPFTEMSTDGLPHVSEDGSLDPSEGKLGRHLLDAEDVMQYEPELMAEAVRTMMTKDE